MIESGGYSPSAKELASKRSGSLRISPDNNGFSESIAMWERMARKEAVSPRQTPEQPPVNVEPTDNVTDITTAEPTRVEPVEVASASETIVETSVAENVENHKISWSEKARQVARVAVSIAQEKIAYAQEHPREAAAAVGKFLGKNMSYAGLGLAVRSGVMAAGASLWWISAPAIGLGASVVSALRDQELLHKKVDESYEQKMSGRAKKLKNARELHTKYVGTDVNAQHLRAVREGGVSDENGYWKMFKRVALEGVGRSTAEMGYGVKEYEERYNNAVALLHDEKRAGVTESELFDAVADASGYLYRMTDVQERKVVQETIKGLYGALTEVALKQGHGKAFVRDEIGKRMKEREKEFLRDTTKASLSGSFGKGVDAMLGAKLAEGLWKMPGFLATFGEQRVAEVSQSVTVPTHEVVHSGSKKALYSLNPESYTATQPNGTEVGNVVVSATTKNAPAVAFSSTAEQHTAVVAKDVVKINKGEWLFKVLGQNGFDISEKGSGSKFLKLYADQFQLSEDQMRELKNIIARYPTISAAQLQAKFSWFDTAFRVGIGQEIEIREVVPQISEHVVVEASERAFLEQVKNGGGAKILAKLNFTPDHQPVPQPPQPPITPPTDGVVRYRPTARPSFDVSAGSSAAPVTLQAESVPVPVSESSVVTTEVVRYLPSAPASFSVAESSVAAPVVETTSRSSDYYREYYEAMRRSYNQPITDAVPVVPLPQRSDVVRYRPSAQASFSLVSGADQPVVVAPVVPVTPVTPAVVEAPEAIRFQPTAEPSPAVDALLSGEQQNMADRFFAENPQFLTKQNPILDINVNNTTTWTFVPEGQTIPLNPENREIIVTRVWNRWVLFVHGSRTSVEGISGRVDLPGNNMREMTEGGLFSQPLGSIQIEQRMRSIASGQPTVPFTGGETFYLRSAQLMRYETLVRQNFEDLKPFISNTLPDSITVIYCGRSHSGAIDMGISYLQSINMINDPRFVKLIDPVATNEEIQIAVSEMFKYIQQNNTQVQSPEFGRTVGLYEEMRRLYDAYGTTGADILNNNQYFFSGTRQILELSPHGRG